MAWGRVESDSLAEAVDSGIEGIAVVDTPEAAVGTVVEEDCIVVAAVVVAEVAVEDRAASDIAVVERHLREAEEEALAGYSEMHSSVHPV